MRQDRLSTQEERMLNERFDDVAQAKRELEELTRQEKEKQANLMQQIPVSFAEQPKQVTPSKAEVAKVVNPVLRRLREKFGLQNIKKHVEVIDDVSYTLRCPSRDLMIWANSMAIIVSNGVELDYNQKISTCLAAIYVSHIDGQSIPDIFGGENIKEAHLGFLNFMLYESKDIDDKLVSAYQKYIEPNAMVLSELDKLNSTQKVYECPECGDKISQSLGKYYCYKDGKEMILITVEVSHPLA